MHGSQVCGGDCLQLFRWEELELLICGSPVLDFEALHMHVHACVCTCAYAYAYTIRARLRGKPRLAFCIALNAPCNALRNAPCNAPCNALCNATAGRQGRGRQVQGRHGPDYHEGHPRQLAGPHCIVHHIVRYMVHYIVSYIVHYIVHYIVPANWPVCLAASRTHNDTSPKLQSTRPTVSLHQNPDQQLILTPGLTRSS